MTITFLLSFVFIQISSIKDSARDLAALPQETLKALKKQYKPVRNSSSIVSVNSPGVNSRNYWSQSEGNHPPLTELTKECSVSVNTKSVPQCSPSSAMAGATPLYGAAALTSSSSRNESKAAPKAGSKLWNNNNNIELMPRDSKNVHSVISFDILNGNGVDSSESKSVNRTSNIDNTVPECSSGTAKTKNGKSLSNLKVANRNKVHTSKGKVSLAPYSEQKIFQSAVELIDSRPCARSSTCPKPVFVDPNKPDRVLQVEAGGTDMAAAASSASTNTKKTELRGVRLTSSANNKNPLPNGSINNKKTPGVSSSTVPKVNSVPNDETPLMGNSQRTDSSVCVKQPTKYGTNVPSTRHDHLQSSTTAGYGVDSDEPQDKSKLVLSSRDTDGTVASKHATLGEQFEASKAIEGKRKKSKKKKKNKG